MSTPERSVEMAYYLVQVAFSPEAWGAMLKKPRRPLEDLRPLLERLGGKLESCWLAFGEYDALLICQLPDHTGAAALSMAASAGGTIRTIKTTPLMTVEESFDAVKKAAGTNDHGSSSAPLSGGLPVPRSKQVDYREILSSRLHTFRRRMEKMVTGR
jgi:uncharacterized protein with GYD domain